MKLQINQYAPASTPFIVHVNVFEHTYPSNNQIYIKLINLYKPIKDVHQFLLIDKQITFKIVTTQKQQERQLENINKQINKQKISYVSGNIIIKQDRIQCQNVNQNGNIKLQGKIINKSQGLGKTFQIELKSISKYSQFYKFRHKYKTMENITRKLTFKLDHRLKIVQTKQKIGNQLNKQYFFNLDSSDNNQNQANLFFIDSKQSISIILQQIYSVDQWYQIKEIHEQSLDLQTLSKEQYSYILKFQYQSLVIELILHMIKNDNAPSFSQIMSLRVLQCNKVKDRVKISTNNLREYKIIQPLLDDRYYDYQYGYLSQNLKSAEIDSPLHQNLQRLTKIDKKYPNFTNQTLIDIKGANKLDFESYADKTQSSKNKQDYEVGFVHILKGYNIIHSKQGWIKIYVQFIQKYEHNQNIKNIKQQKETYSHKLYQLEIKDIWNLEQIQQDKFSLKILCNSQLYSIPFITEIVDDNNFKKQSKQLDIKSSFSQKVNNKFYMIQKKDKNKIKIVSTQFIKNFYLLDFVGNSVVDWQINTENNILMSGSIWRKQIQNNNQNQFKILLSSINCKKQIIVIINIHEIPIKNSSLRSVYNFKYALLLTDGDVIPADTHYDLQIKKVGKQKNRKMRKKVNPQYHVKGDQYKLKVFFEQGFFSKFPQQQLSLSLRRMHYDEQKNTFDNQPLINKTVIINPDPQKLLQTITNTIILKFNQEQQSYQIIKFDCYDNIIKQKLSLIIQISLKKLAILDSKKSKYIIKIPLLLWNTNISQYFKQNDNIQIQCLLSRKKDKNNKKDNKNQNNTIVVPYGSNQQYQLPAWNYKDALSIRINQSVGFARIIDGLKVKCQIVKDQIGWIPQSQWYLMAINIEDCMFYCLLKSQYDPNQNQQQSQKSQKTISKGKSEKSNSKKIDPLAKTMKNMDLYKLKQIKNKAIIENRQLTAKIVKRQQTIAILNKKIIQYNQQISKKNQIDKQIKQSQIGNNNNVNKKQNQKKVKIYRQICQCGQKDPKFNGYCQKCLIILKKRYQTYLLEYQEKTLQFQKIKFNKNNKKSKINKLKNKLRNYYQKIRSGQDIQEKNIDDIVGELQQKDLKRKIEQLKIDIFQIQMQKKQILQQHWQQAILDDKIKKEEKQIQISMKQLEQVKLSVKKQKQGS